MYTKHWRTWRVTLVMLTLLTSVYFSGCQAVTPTKVEAPSSGTTEPSHSPTSQETPQVPTSEQKTMPIPEPKTEPVPEQKAETSPLVPADESDNNPAPTPPPALPQTPIHPYYDLGGNPPSAPRLAMRVRVFSGMSAPEMLQPLSFGQINSSRILKAKYLGSRGLLS